MKVTLAAALGLSLASCATLPTDNHWVAVRHQDPFTDQTSCRVGPVGLQSGSGPLLAMTMPFHYYPFVEMRAGSLRVGLIAGGRFRIPTGRVQLRIDDNPAWIIDTSETPMDMAGGPAALRPCGPYRRSRVQERLVQAQQAAMASVGQAVSPFTVATGEKAQRILAQMKVGRQIIYQTAGFNQPGSTLGQTSLGPEFLSALQVCGL